MPQKVGLTACAGVETGPARSPGSQSSLEENWSAQYLHRTCRDRRHVSTPPADICEDQDANEGDCGTPKEDHLSLAASLLPQSPEHKADRSHARQRHQWLLPQGFLDQWLGLPGGFLRFLAVLARLSGDLAGHVLGVLRSLLGVPCLVERGV